MHDFHNSCLQGVLALHLSVVNFCKTCLISCR